VKVKLIKRSFRLRGQSPTSIQLEEPFWRALDDITAAKNMTIEQFVQSIDSLGSNKNRTSAVRLYVLEHFLRRIEASSKA
jgi:predicted DNA-binding ribbon-helix-helix protein